MNKEGLKAAFIVSFLRDTIQDTKSSTFSKEALLVLLKIVSEDPLFFPEGEGERVWDLTSLEREE